MRAKTAPRDLQGGKAPTRPTSGRRITIKGHGVPPAVLAPCGHAIGGKPPKIKKPRGGAAIQVVEDAPQPLANAERTTVAISQLVPSATNPRQHFDEGKLAELAESIRQVGLLQPIVVRRRLHQLEIVAGERRWRAAQLAGLATVDVAICALDDWQALKVQWTENAERHDINEIEVARHFQRMLDAREGLTQQQLAEELGTSQGQIANRLRLLELPEGWQQKVISQEITATHARELVPFVRHTEALNDVAEQIQRDGACGSVKQFRETIEECVAAFAVALNGAEWDSASQSRVHWKVPLTPEQRNDWGVVETDGYRGKVLFAIPCDEAEQAADQARQFRIDEARKKADKRNKKAAAARPGESPQAAANRKDEQFAKRLAAWKTDWLRVLCASRLGQPDNARLAEMFFLAMVQEPDVWNNCDDFEQIVERIPTAPKLHWSASIYEMVRQAATAVELDELRIEMARSLLIDVDGEPRQVVEHDDVEDLANELELPADLEAIWREEQANGLSEGYWSLHTKDQLEALAEELAVEFRETSKAGMVEQLLETKGLRLPAELGGGAKATKQASKKKPAAKAKGR